MGPIIPHHICLFLLLARNARCNIIYSTQHETSDWTRPLQLFLAAVFCLHALECAADKLQFHGSSFLVASSPHPRRQARGPTRRLSCVSGVSGDFPIQLATRLPDWWAGGLLRCIGLVLPVCPCVVSFSKFHEPDTSDLLRTYSREYHTRMLY